jgi:hypothetical protein
VKTHRFAAAGTSPIPDPYSIFNECECSTRCRPGGPAVVTYTTRAYDSSYVNPIVGYWNRGLFPSNVTGRDAFRSPGDWKIDFGVHKNFKLTARVNLEVRGEIFNFFNHANLYVENEGSGGSAVIT